ncbi:DUF4283 domain protein, partial [Trifolium medium]|nr:DUF4283 domain protein [Trifolium medium]
VLNSNVAQDLEILQQYWKQGNDTRDIMHKVYTDKEEWAASINFLKNRATASEEPIIEVVSKAKKKICRRVFRFIIPAQG